MSSHYIIREDQEPALFIADLEAVEYHVIESLLEWAPHVLITEGAIPMMLEKEIKTDALFVENASLNWKSLLAYQWPVKIFELSLFPNNLIGYLKGKNITELNIIHSFENYRKGYLDQLVSSFRTVAFYCGCLKYQFSRNGRFEKWISPGRRLLIPNYRKEDFWISETIAEIEDGRFEVVREGIVTVRSKQDFWIAEAVLC